MAIAVLPLALKALWDGQSMMEVCRTQGIQRKTLEKWLDSYLHGGFDALFAPQKRPRPQTLAANRLYEIFDELGLSHQRAHRDCGPSF